MNRPGYIDVDKLQAETTLTEAAAKCRASLDATGSGREVRIDCPFGCPGDHAGRKEVSINTENPQKVFCCHSYQCGFRGNLLTLMHGWLTGQRPTSDKLKGEEFNRVKAVLAGVASQVNAVLASAEQPAAKRQPEAKAPAPQPAAAPAQQPDRNIPLADSENEKARELLDIDRKFVVDVAAMNPKAAAYVRQHRSLSPESMRKWCVGYLPNDGGGDKRGWSLRGHIVYPMLNEQGKLLAWVGRDPAFDEKLREFNALPPEQRSGKEPAVKHRFPKGFHRGLELFGQHAARLEEPGYRESVAKLGIVVVEGFNDVIGLDNIAVPAVAICSNRITQAQVAKIVGWARQLGGGKVSLLFDCEDTGDEGAKEAVWLFAQRGVDVRLGWSGAMHGGAFVGRQPESLSRKEWDEAIRPLFER